MLWLRLAATALGAFSSLVMAASAYRASMLHLKAHIARTGAARVTGTRTGRLLETLANRFDEQAGWRPRDHVALVASICGLLASYLLHFTALLIGG